MKIKYTIEKLIRRFVKSSDFEESNFDEFREQIIDIKFQFRQGFPERVVARLKTVRKIDPLEIYYKNLSGLFPKIVGFSFAAIILMGIVVFALHGTLSPDKLLGADRVDETNFITYLIIQR